MSFSTEYYDWQGTPQPGPGAPWLGCSQNLLVLKNELERRWGALQNVGCLSVAKIEGTDLWSTHAYGAAIDLQYGAGADNRTRADQIIGYLVGWSAELHVSAVHDYVACRIWHANRTARQSEACTAWWRAQRRGVDPAMGQPWATWLHIETTPDGWEDDTPIAERGVY